MFTVVIKVISKVSTPHVTLRSRMYDKENQLCPQGRNRLGNGFHFKDDRGQIFKTILFCAWLL